MFDASIDAESDVMLPYQDGVKDEDHNGEEELGEFDILELGGAGGGEVFDENHDKREEASGDVEEHVHDAEAFCGLAVVVQEDLEEVFEGRDDGLVEAQEGEEPGGGGFDWG